MKLAIIGGSLLGEIHQLTDIAEERISTPFGEPSDICITGSINNTEVVYVNRHGRSHHIAPHQVNYRANMFMLKVLEVSHVIAVTAVGGITEKMSPMQWVVPDQLIDYTYGREHTYNEDNGDAVNHIELNFPFEDGLRKKLQQAIKMESMECLTPATYGVTQGPRLETSAEIKRMERDGCDIVGMTAMPEAALARELEMNYATLSLVVNWAAGKGTTGSDKTQQTAEIISMDEIKQRIADGNEKVEDIIRNVITLFD